MKLGEIIKNYRKHNNLTMQSFADMSGLSKGYVSMLEKNKHPQNKRELIPSLTTLRKVATAMNIGTGELIKMLEPETVMSKS